MNDRTLLYASVGISLATLVIVTILAQHLNQTADSADKATQGLLGNERVQTVLTEVSKLFGGGK